jgi:hypothetical protein
MEDIKTLQQLKDESAQKLGYTDWEEAICIEDGPPNPDNINTIIAEIAEFLFEEQGWTLSRKKMPDFDGMYYVYGFMHHPCGNVTPFHKIVECRMNQWVKSDVGEQMTYWRTLLCPPVVIDKEDEIVAQFKPSANTQYPEFEKTTFYKNNPPTIATDSTVYVGAAPDTEVEKPDFDKYISVYVGLRPEAKDLTPMDKGECKVMLNQIWNDHVLPLHSLLKSKKEEIERLKRDVSDKESAAIVATNSAKRRGERIKELEEALRHNHEFLLGVYSRLGQMVDESGLQDMRSELTKILEVLTPKP